MKKEYKLFNRYREDVKLVEVEPNVYILNCVDNEYIRLGYCENPNDGFDYVDPPGGPFMRINCFKLGDHVLSKIIMKDGKILLTFSEYKRPYDNEAFDLNSLITEIILKYAKKHNMKFSEVHYRMDTTEDSLSTGELLPDTDINLQIIDSNGEIVGYNT